jgi:serine/threonine-protein kinase
MTEREGSIRPGAEIGHYQVIALLGAGGMGEVYRCHDPRLGRDVAVKVLPADVADPNARARLLREAQLASSLNHPNICTIYEVGEAGGRTYVAMEWIDGRTLDRVIPPHGLPAESAARIGAAIAAALAFAHRNGIVHRDLKSANVMIGSDGRVKVMDFGLARRPADLDTADARRLTSTGVVVGSPQYMAPEVLRGGAADARSDLWALGVVLHEMCAGSLPFQGQSSIELGAAILNAEPMPLPAGVPATLRAVVQRCMAKDPSQRFQVAEEVRAVLETALTPGAASGALTAAGTASSSTSMASSSSAVSDPAHVAARRRSVPAWAIVAVALGALAIVLALGLPAVRARLGLGSEAGRIRSLAVLPLENLSRDPEQEYFTDGMTDELIASLAGLEGVRVISRTSVMKYKGTRKGVPQIARELGVDGIIEGSAMKAGGRVRITAQLIDAAHDRHLWANHYERDLSDVLALQDDVSQSIAGEIRVALTPSGEARHQNVRPVDPAAHEAYLRGRYAWNRRTKAGLETAIAEFERAVTIDSSYAPAWAALAQTYVIANDYAGWSYQRADSSTQQAAERALALDDRIAGAHLALAEAKTLFDWDWKGAGIEFSRALELDPNDATGHQWYANYLLARGHSEAAIGEIDQAMRLDPLSLIVPTARGDCLRSMGRSAEAEAQLEEVLRLDPAFEPACVDLFLAAEAAGHFDRAIEAHSRFAHLAGFPDDGPELRRAYAAGGERGYFQAVLEQTKRVAGRGQIPYSALAYLYIHVGEPERAIEVLERSVDSHDAGLITLGVDVMWKPLSSNPRFQALLRRIGAAS